MSPVIRFPPVEPDIVVRENIDLAGFKIIHTPGHTDGSISLYLPGKLIFVGDALRSDAKGNLKPPSKMLSADIVQAKASVALITGLDFDTLLVGHGAPVKGEASAKVKKLLENWK
jgi:glyoxylase-like metal-dependent hydrolase (beta-lactamase superfamily II)